MQSSKDYECTVTEVAQLLDTDSPPYLLDVREQSEWDIVRLNKGQLVDRSLIEEILVKWEKDTPIVCYCHHGIRSLEAVFYLRRLGFTNVKSMQGGIDHWAAQIDPSMPRY